MKKAMLSVRFTVAFPVTYDDELDSWIKDWTIEQLKENFDGVTERDIDFEDEMVYNDEEEE